LLGLLFSHTKYLLTSGIHPSFKEFLIEQIEKYQKEISPKLSSVCLFEPSCSHYALLSVQKYGAFKGAFKAVIRVLKCSPLTKRLASGQIIDMP
jgi:putative membrane protein insertion efficiency factor